MFASGATATKVWRLWQAEWGERGLNRKSRSAISSVRTATKSGRGTAKKITAGQRIGSKRSDRRWLAPDNTIWDSRFEYEVFLALKEQGYNVRKTTAEDSLPFTSKVVGGKCLQCGSCCVAKQHTLTADLLVSPTLDSGGKNVGAGYYIEVKGFVRSPRRSLLRAFRKAQPDVDFRFVIQRDYRVGATTLAGWITKYLKAPVHIWNGKLPADWGR